ncbi:MAG TPA: hypothetical protein VGJ09_11725 [Bryobacteraceae bacterium]|jgi:hypothetical protein
MKPQKFVVWLLLLSLATPAFPADGKLLKQARKFPRGTHVRIELKTHQNVEGSLGEVTETELHLEPFRFGAAATSYAFGDISKIRSTERKPRKTWVKVLTAPVVYPLEILGWIAILAVCGGQAALGQDCMGEL